MVQGASNAEIARLLGGSSKTIASYASNILNKLRVADRAEAVIRTREPGLGSEREYGALFAEARFALGRTIPVQGELHVIEGLPT